MHALAAQGSEQKKKACRNIYTDELGVRLCLTFEAKISVFKRG